MPKIKGKGELIEASFDGPSKLGLSPLTSTKSLILLSIRGNSHCEGDYLAAILKEAIEHYGFSTFLIADEIYWHNLKKLDSCSEKDILDYKMNALSIGDKYIEEMLIMLLKILNYKPTEQYATFDTSKKISFINQFAKDN